jgi:gliding motility-associated lipoprotein GldH
VVFEQADGTIQKDTIEITLANTAGKWLGEGFGKTRTVQAVYKRKINIEKSGGYKISIQQGMREDKLEGIKEIGIHIEKSGA